MLHIRLYKLDGNKNPQSPTFLLGEPFKPGGGANDQCFHSRAFSAYLLLQRPQHPAPTAAQTSARLRGAPGSPHPSFCHPVNALKPHGFTPQNLCSQVQEASQARTVASTVAALLERRRSAQQPHASALGLSVHAEVTIQKGSLTDVVVVVSTHNSGAAVVHGPLQFSAHIYLLLYLLSTAALFISSTSSWLRPGDERSGQQKHSSSPLWLALALSTPPPSSGFERSL